MIRQTSRLRRGAALLITLATMVVILTAAATAARIASTARLTSRVDAAAATADDVLLAAEAPIARWLENESQFIVLSPDVIAPAIEVLHDQIELHGASIELHITA